MSGSVTFRSWLGSHFERFVALQRAGGAQYDTQQWHLERFDRHLERDALEPLSRDTVFRYLDLLNYTPRSRDNVISVLWQALRYASRQGAAVEPLGEPPPPAPRGWRRRPPRIVSLEEVRSLLNAARTLPPLSILRPATLATLLGLLYTTGIRVGEALALDVAHLEPEDGLLHVHRGKFGKSRTLVLKPSTVTALVRYIEEPRRRVGTHDAAPLFFSRQRRRLSYPTFLAAFQAVCKRAELKQPWPRPHDFRHSFALNRVANWYAQRRDVNSLLPVLSTYLGHAAVEHTRVYLTQNGILLEHAATRFAELTKALDEVSS